MPSTVTVSVNSNSMLMSNPSKRRTSTRCKPPPSKRVHLEEVVEWDTDTSVQEALEDPSYQPSSSCGDYLFDNTRAEIPPPVPLQEMRKFLVYEACLLELFSTCPVCLTTCAVNTQSRGTFLSVQQKCPSCLYRREWKSQPVLGSLPAGNLHLAAAVCFTGASFVMLKKVMDALRVKTITERRYHQLAKSHLNPTIVYKWQTHQTELLQSLSQKEGVSLGGDMRADSPGHCAKFGSYSVMDLESNKIVDIQLVQSNEVGSSTSMEKEGLNRSLAFLEGLGVKIDCLVTDRHPQIQKYLREHKPYIKHFYDVWHVAKGVTRKIEVLAKERDCGELKEWLQSISNHMYWCASSSAPGEETVAKWTSLINRVHGSPSFPTCQHAENSGTSKWLKPASKPTCRLELIVPNKRLLKDVAKLSPLYQTSSIEGFHSLILRFAPKCVAYSYPGMLCRLMLAGLHYNENADQKGDLVFEVRYPKRKRGGYTVNKQKTKPTTCYVDSMLDMLFQEVVSDPGPFVASFQELRVQDPLCARFERPD